MIAARRIAFAVLLVGMLTASTRASAGGHGTALMPEVASIPPLEPPLAVERLWHHDSGRASETAGGIVINLQSVALGFLISGTVMLGRVDECRLRGASPDKYVHPFASEPNIFDCPNRWNTLVSGITLDAIAGAFAFGGTAIALATVRRGHPRTWVGPLAMTLGGSAAVGVGAWLLAIHHQGTCVPGASNGDIYFPDPTDMSNYLCRERRNTLVPGLLLSIFGGSAALGGALWGVMVIRSERAPRVTIAPSTDGLTVHLKASW